MKIPNTVSELSKYVATVPNPYQKLAFQLYSRGHSHLHKAESPLVAKIDKIKKDLGITSTTQAAVHLMDGLKDFPVCKHCGVNKTRFNRSYYLDCCSQKCSKLSDAVRQKTAATMNERFGSDGPFGSAEIREKRRKSLLERHGVEHSGQIADFAEKVKQTNLKRRGVEHSSHDPDVQSKRIKSGIASKTIEIDGIVFEGLQGYEPAALTYLVEQENRDPRSLITHTKKTFDWVDANGKHHVYHPDIKIRGKKHIIEVKSMWTFKNMPHERARNKGKRDGVLAAGYKMTFLIMGPKGLVSKKTYAP